jgi:hypothetical protein
MQRRLVQRFVSYWLTVRARCQSRPRWYVIEDNRMTYPRGAAVFSLVAELLILCGAEDSVHPTTRPCEPAI